MDAAAARETLGLSGVVTERKLRQRYRRLVLRYHPDKPRGDRERFQRINDAYRVLERHLHAGGPTDALGICRQCRRRPAWRRGLDRNAYCRDCLVYAGGRRLLPGPPAVVVRCIISILANAVACVCLLMFLATQRPVWGITGLVAGVAGLVALAITAIAIGEVVSPRRSRRR
jgi:hypothetical protein